MGELGGPVTAGIILFLRIGAVILFVVIIVGLVRGIVDPENLYALSSRACKVLARVATKIKGKCSKKQPQTEDGTNTTIADSDDGEFIDDDETEWVTDDGETSASSWTTASDDSSKVSEDPDADVFKMSDFRESVTVFENPTLEKISSQLNKLSRDAKKSGNQKTWLEKDGKWGVYNLEKPGSTAQKKVRKAMGAMRVLPQ